MIEIDERDGHTSFRIRVVPRASRTELAGEIGGAVKVRIASPPVDGAANAELIKLLAKVFDIARSDIEIIAGHSSRSKRIRLTGVTAAQLQNALG